MRTKPVNIDEASRISIYPNPVTGDQFVVQFGQIEPGNYIVQVTDVTGRQVIQRSVTISGENQSQVIKINSSSSRGVYMIKVLGSASKTIFSTKIVVQ
jgi:hypothetical protein